MAHNSVLSYEDIHEIVDKLHESIGLRLNVGVELPYAAVTKHNFNEFCNLITKQLELPIIVEPNFSGNFETTGMTKFHSSEESSGVSAQITIPGNLPKYGSPFLIGFKIDVHVKLGIGEPYPLLTQLSHEFSHIYLFSNRNEQKESEYATDICALMMGFGPIWEKGRKTIRKYTEIRGYVEKYEHTTTTTTTLGYLSDNEYQIAIDYINSLRKPIENLRCEIKKVLSSIRKTLDELKEMFQLLFQLFDIHYKNKCKVKIEDGIHFSRMSQPHFKDDFEDFLKVKKNEINSLIKILNEKRIFKAYDKLELEQQLHKLEDINETLNNRLAEMKELVSIVKNNLSFICKLKLRFKR